MAYRTNLSLPATDLGLLIFRVGVSALMLPHGYGKLMQFFSEEKIAFADPIGIGEMASLALTVFAEFICSILIILGLGTRLAAIPLLITMLVAIFIVHASDGMSHQELPLLYLFSYILLMLTGSGKYSLDHFFLKK
ncbi:MULTISPECIES: DoxX family protein [Mesonia]|uniref:Oxidoreductase MhqP n=1 Tax=Mesonia oceanica TaxID=2687242 RepID=A0AC61YA69_9FLAO|nr:MULTISPECIES: DoxX family protein [Mesonia]MAN27818.1 DoxX family protein [Mesonia sp.]MAQ40998.1 DoxX family protein [Mesonia sp.]MBJ96462.1 DoxX family protein [Flavobacteriaceae bacterium]VVV01090.1 Putative oxidoreductase MhqP [Mesonia oceanica]|tara:strand:- start:543 stop:950 length:408 start_codon:yes stop_codon:yes gene_type:complete